MSFTWQGWGAILLKEILAFEIKYHIGQSVFYLGAMIFFTVGLLLMSTNAGIALSDVPSTVNRDAPPGNGFEPVTPDLEDVYFTTLRQA
jgi:hypothetical protein